MSWRMTIQAEKSFDPLIGSLHPRVTTQPTSVKGLNNMLFGQVIVAHPNFAMEPYDAIVKRVTFMIWRNNTEFCEQLLSKFIFLISFL